MKKKLSRFPPPFFIYLFGSNLNWKVWVVYICAVVWRQNPIFADSVLTIDIASIVQIRDIGTSSSVKTFLLLQIYGENILFNYTLQRHLAVYLNYLSDKRNSPFPNAVSGIMRGAIKYEAKSNS